MEEKANFDDIDGESIKQFLKHPIDFQGLQRYERDEYPVDAVREMILNALVHRNYLGAQTQLRLRDHSLSIWNDGIPGWFQSYTA